MFDIDPTFCFVAWYFVQYTLTWILNCYCFNHQLNEVKNLIKKKQLDKPLDGFLPSFVLQVRLLNSRCPGHNPLPTDPCPKGLPSEPDWLLSWQALWTYFAKHLAHLEDSWVEASLSQERNWVMIMFLIVTASCQKLNSNKGLHLLLGGIKSKKVDPLWKNGCGDTFFAK